MDDAELEAYFSANTWTLNVFHMKTFIDFEDIEEPFKSVAQNLIKIEIEVATTIKQRIYLQSHQFNDLPMRMQIGAEPVE